MKWNSYYAYTYVHIGKTIRDYANIKEEERVIEVYGSESTKESYAFQWPYLLAKGPKGELIVGNNSENARHLVLFDEQLKYSRVISSKGEGHGKFLVIRGITVDKKGFLYVTDGELNCIQKFALHDGKFVTQLGKKGKENGQFEQPTGLLVSKSNLLFVCDRHNHRIQVFQDDDFFYKFGEKSERPEALNEPVDLTLNNSEQKLFITCWRDSRVQIFKPNGVYIGGIKAGFLLWQPNGIFFTPDNHLLVTSTTRVMIFKEDGTFVSAIKGIYNGKERFINSIGVAMMNDGKIVISDGLHGSNRLIVYWNTNVLHFKLKPNFVTL